MNYLKNNPVGIDIKIDRIQRKIYDSLVQKWGSLDMYGRAYKVQDKSKVNLKIYAGNGEYKPILFSEGNKVFFMQGDRPEINYGIVKNDVWVVSILNIEKIKNIPTIADEEVHFDLITALNSCLSSKEIKNLEYGMNNLKRVVEDIFSFGNFNFSDVHPYHVFMVKINLEYSLIENNC